MPRGVRLSEEMLESLGGREGNMVAEARYPEVWHAERGDVCPAWPTRENHSNGWWFQGSRIWNPHQGKVSRRQGGNEPSGKALSSLSLETGKQRLDSQWAWRAF